MNKDYYLKILLKDALNDSYSSDITSFSDSDPAYYNTNENLFLYPKMNLENKKVLTVTSSGDHALLSIFKGAKDIDSFDVNIYSKYIAELKIAMMKKYNFEKYWYVSEFFANKEDFNYSKKHNILEDIKDYLSEDSYLFWKCFKDLLDARKIKFSNIIYAVGYYKKDNICYSYDNYNIIKERLNDAKINYFTTDLSNINNYVACNYDAIFLSNILEYVLSSDAKHNIDRYQILMNNLDKILNIDGCIYGYEFQRSGNYFNNLPNKSKYKYEEKSIINPREFIYDKAYSLKKLM